MGGISATFPRPLRTSRSLAQQLIWTEPSRVQTILCGVKITARQRAPRLALGGHPLTVRSSKREQFRGAFPILLIRDMD